MIRCLQLDPDDLETLYLYARFLALCSKNELAEEFYLRTLEIEPNHHFCLRDYGTYLSVTGDMKNAERMWARARAIQLSSE